MAFVKTYKDLLVWQNAMELAMEIFERTRAFPPEERYSLTDQLRRSSRSVASNIAEGWRKRRYQAAFIAKLSDSEGEAAETQTSTEVARRCRYWSQAVATDIDTRYEEILSQLVKMIDNAPSWCIQPVRRIKPTE